jgi:hypothetical protein
VRGLAHGRVVHAQIAADRAHDDIPRVETDPDLHLQALRPAKVIRIAPHDILHPEGGIAGAHGVVLVGERRAEEAHDAVTHHLVHGALVVMDRFHHPLQNGIEELARFLWVTVGEQLHGPLEVGEEHRHLLALALQGGLRGQDLLGEVFRSVRCGAGQAARWLSGERGAAGSAELLARRDRGATARTGSLKPGATVLAEACARVVLSLAPGTLHLTSYPPRMTSSFPR